MPLPFIIGGVVAAATAYATSETCNRCGDTFWRSECSYYCDYCCTKRENEKREEREKEAKQKEFNKKENRKILNDIESYKEKSKIELKQKYKVLIGFNSEANSANTFGNVKKIKVISKNNTLEKNIEKLENETTEILALIQELEAKKNETTV